MSNPDQIVVPGEQLIGAHPWVRCVGDRVVRYINPTIEDPAITFLRKVKADDVLETVLGRFAAKIETEVSELRTAGLM